MLHVYIMYIISTNIWCKSMVNIPYMKQIWLIWPVLQKQDPGLHLQLQAKSMGILATPPKLPP